MRDHVPDNSIHLIVTSPPYSDIREYNGYKLDLFELGRQCYRTLVDGGIMAMVIQDGTKNFAKSLTSFRTTVQYVDNIGFRLFESVIYSRAGRPGAWWNQRFRVDHEYIMIFLKGKRPRHFNKEPLKIPAKHAGKTWAGTQRHTDGSLTPIKRTIQKDLKCRGTIWNYSTSNTESDPLKLLHPATFPDLLAEDLIICFSDIGNIVCDPMVGSGTTAKIAKRLNRHYIGIDISPKYCDLARQSINGE